MVPRLDNFLLLLLKIHLVNTQFRATKMPLVWTPVPLSDRWWNCFISEAIVIVECFKSCLLGNQCVLECVALDVIEL